MDYQEPILELIRLEEAEDIITVSWSEWGDGEQEDLTGTARGWQD